MSSPFIATVVMLNVNAPEMTCAAVDSLLAQTIAERLKIIVVDNGSTDDSAQKIEERFGSRIQILRSEVNLGFAAGNNFAFHEAEGEYLLLLNNDAVAVPEWAEELIRAAREHGAGMCTSKILTYHDHSLVDCVGHQMYPDGVSRSRGNWQRDDGRFDREEETLLASGCAALYKRKVVMDWGGFDESFFAYQEDVDLGLKLRLAGEKCVYVPAAVVYHHGSWTESKNPFPKVFLIERNRVWVMLRYFPMTWILVSPWHTLRRLWLSFHAARAGRGRIGAYAKKHSIARLGWSIFSGWCAALWRLPRELGIRRLVRKNARISKKEFVKLLQRFRAPLEEMAYE